MSAGSAGRTMASAVDAVADRASASVGRGVGVDVAGVVGVPNGAGTPGRRRRRESISTEEVVRGAPDEVLARPAVEVLASVTWEGFGPDPDVLDAVTFLAWL